jgi:hypothetical protein
MGGTGFGKSVHFQLFKRELAIVSFTRDAWYTELYSCCLSEFSVAWINVMLLCN